MSYLELSDPKTDSCDFKVKLSNPFNTNYYKKLRITSRYYGSSTSSVSTYVESRTARSSSSRYVRGIVNDGLSAGNTYKLYAYAQAQNGTWYKAGSDYITMEDAGSEDLKIKSIEALDPLNAGQKTEFKVVVKNYGDGESEDYVVRVYDENGTQLDYDTEPGRDPGQTGNAYLDVTLDEPGLRRLKFKVDGDSSDTEYEDFNFRYNIQSLLDATKTGASMTDVKNLVDDVLANKTFTPVGISLMKDLRDSILIKMGINPQERGVLGVTFKAGAEFIIGANAGAGGYICNDGQLTTTSVGLQIATNVGGHADVSIVIFPFMKTLDALMGVGITMGGSVGPVSADITNCQPETICIAFNCGANIGDPIPSEGYITAGYSWENQARKLTQSQMDALMDRINSPNFANAL